MRYTKHEAKDFTREHLRGIWAATMTPFTEDVRGVDSEGFRSNIRHFVDNLEIDGFFVGGKQGEFFSMTLGERKELAETAVSEAHAGPRPAGAMISASDQNLDTVVDLARHAQDIGADYAVVHAPVLNFGRNVDSTVYDYYSYVASQVDIGIAMWSHPDAGYLMSPELCARIARDIPNIVAIKYSVPRDMYVRLTEMAGDYLIVSTASEAEWFDNIVDLGWQAYLCSAPPYLIQTSHDKRMREYTDLAFDGQVENAREVRDSLEPVRRALTACRPDGTPQASQKYWMDLLGQAGGRVRRPLLNLSDIDKEKVRAALEGSGLKTSQQVSAG